MKKIILITMVLLGLAFASFAGDTNLFNSNEFAVSADTFYQPKTTYSLNAEARASYFLTRNFGLEANLPFYTQGAVAVQDVGLNLLARLPLEVTIPLINKSVGLSPYLGVGTDYSWTPKTFTYDGKFGAELRWTKSYGLFAEGQYNFAHWTSSDIKDGSLGFRGGLKLVL